MTQAHNARGYLFLLLCERLVKRGTYGINYYITIEFDFVKGDSRHALYEGVVYGNGNGFA